VLNAPTQINDASVMRFSANKLSWLVDWGSHSAYRVGTWRTIVWLFENILGCAVILGTNDIWMEMVEISFNTYFRHLQVCYFGPEPFWTLVTLVVWTPLARTEVDVLLIANICTFGVSPGSTGQVRTWRSSGQGQGHRSKKRFRVKLCIMPP